MSSILDRAKAHYADQPRREIKVPEWGDHDGPAVITWSPLTVRDRERIYAADEKGRAPAGGIVILRAVIIKACDASGNKLFDGMAEHDLRHAVDGEIVGRIANAILFDAGLTEASGESRSVTDQVDAAKNA